jgi:phosphoenolpyruvate carboxylase
MRKLLAGLRVRPVITAHPTEAKRVTVLEKHRRIYRRLVDLESPRWTPRERTALIDQLRNDIELLWTPASSDWKNRPFPGGPLGTPLQRNLFEATARSRSWTLARDDLSGPRQRYRPSAVRFRIGGDRDGNPFVTSLAPWRRIAAPACSATTPDSPSW